LDNTLQSIIERTMATLGPDEHVAVIAHGELRGGVGQADLSIACRMLDGRITLMAGAWKKWSDRELDPTVSDHGLGAQIVWKPF
jgi:hypothetical protein